MDKTINHKLMCCILASFAFLGPRIGVIIWWLLDPSRFAAVFDTILWPILGVILVPWTTAAYVLVSRNGIEGLDWVWIILALLIDLSSAGGSAWSTKKKS